MKFNISDLMSGYQDDTIDLVDPGITNPSRILAKVTGSPVSAPIPRRAPRRIWRTALVAAVLVVALAVSAFAVYQLTMEDRVLEEQHLTSIDGSTISRYSPVGPAAETGSNETNIIESGSMYRASPADSTQREYQALAEWIEYQRTATFTEDEPRLDADSPYIMCYPVKYEVQVEKLEEIAEKYDLQLIESYETFSQLEHFYSLSGLTEFMPLEGAFEDTGSCSGIVYGDGGFMANALKMNLPDSNESNTININVNRAMKGSFCDIYILGHAPDAYINESYTTASGTSVDLALGPWYSMIFAELDNCYVTIFVNGGNDPTEYLDLIGMEDLKFIADSIDYSILEQ